MKRISYWAMLCGLFLTAACSGGGDDPTPKPEPTPTPPDTTHTNPDKVLTVEFLPYLSAPTRATDTQFENGDRIGVWAVESTGADYRGIIGEPHNNYANNVMYVYNGNRFTPYNAGIEVQEGKKFYYTAVYPYQQSAARTFDFDVRADQRPAGAYTASDLCTASTEATGESLVNLRFSHRLVKIVINLTGDGWNSSDITVRLKNVQTRASVDLNKLDFTATGNRTDIYCAENGTHSFKVILPPQTIAQSEKLAVVTMNGVDYTIDTQSAQEYRSGKSYEYNFNLDSPSSEVVIFTGDINPWNVDERINDVVPEDIQDRMGPYIPIYKGNTPPNIEGTVFVNPFSCVYCQDQGQGGYDPGTVVQSSYIRFSNQNSIYNTIDIDQTNADGTDTSTGAGAFISGTGNNFTAYFNTVGQTDGISTKTALVISGTRTSGGISNLRYAFVMVEKGADPNNQLMKEGIFRVFQDQDEFSEYTQWPTTRKGVKANRSASKTLFSAQ